MFSFYIVLETNINKEKCIMNVSEEAGKKTTLSWAN